MAQKKNPGGTSPKSSEKNVMPVYEAVVGVEDADGRYEPGQSFSAERFSAEVVKNWLEIGAIRLKAEMEDQA